MRVSTAVAIAALTAAAFFASSAGAQQSAIVAPGDAAVTGFSGTPNPPTSERIDSNGPSLRVIALPGGGPYGLTNASKVFTARAGDIGQVFGVALDNQPAPNIFAAATAAYGLAIFRPGHGRLRYGAPGAQYTPGQFGPVDQGGGPDSIWRIDGRSGAIALFANVAFNGIQNTPASLGALAFDANTQQLFVSDRATGLIHRFGLDGTDRGTFDHGVQGREEAKLPPVPFDPITLANIQSGKFDTQNPLSWGFAPAERRVFALATHNGRLYYSVAEGSEIWSVGIMNNGAFASDARFETRAPVLRPGAEVSQIAFDGRGWMYAAERGAPTGSPDFVEAANGGSNRVLRFEPKQPGDPSPGNWHLQPDQYAIGMFPNFQNADGGVGLSCGQTLWSTGERLLDPGNARPGSFPAIDGLQGNDAGLVEPANMPPLKAWMVNYYDEQADIDSRGHTGSIAIRNVCGNAPPPPPPPAYGPSCPPGMFGFEGGCFVPPICPPGTLWRDGYCVYPRCPFGLVDIRGECRRPPIVCRIGEVFVNDRCVPVGCPPWLERDGHGYCGCPRDEIYRDGRCVPPCPDQQRDRNGGCQQPCPQGEVHNSDGRCVPPCPRDEIYRDGRCVPPCPDQQRDRNGGCQQPCPQGEVRNSDGRCVPPPCPQGEQRNSDGVCVPPPCPRDEIYRDGRCVAQSCPQGEVRNSDGVCSPVRQSCPRGEVHNSDGVCVPIHVTRRCPRGETLENGRCVSSNGGSTITITRTPPKHHCPRGESERDGRCVSTTSTSHTGGLGCSREAYDQYGHCPGTGGSSGQTSTHHHLRSGSGSSNGGGGDKGDDRHTYSNSGGPDRHYGNSGGNGGGNTGNSGGSDRHYGNSNTNDRGSSGQTKGDKRGSRDRNSRDDQSNGGH